MTSIAAVTMSAMVPSWNRFEPDSATPAVSNPRTAASAGNVYQTVNNLSAIACDFQ